MDSRQEEIYKNGQAAAKAEDAAETVNADNTAGDGEAKDAEKEQTVQKPEGTAAGADEGKKAGGTVDQEEPEKADGGAESAETDGRTETAAGEAGSTKADAGAEPENGKAETEKSGGDAGKAGPGESATDAGEGEDGGPKQGSDGKWHVFGKKKEKKDARDEKIEELTDKLRRQMAEFDNFRKRTEKEKSAMFEIGAKDIIEKILPVIDNFERGLASIPEDTKGTPCAEGMEMIYKQLLKTLEDAGVKPIEAVGQPFNPDFHNAVMHVEDENEGENMVVREFQKGYMYHDSVIRHSMVQVAN